MKAYSVLDVIVKDESWVPAYMESVGDIVSKPAFFKVVVA